MPGSALSLAARGEDISSGAGVTPLLFDVTIRRAAICSAQRDALAAPSRTCGVTSAYPVTAAREGVRVPTARAGAAPQRPKCQPQRTRLLDAYHLLPAAAEASRRMA